jgi:ribonuclease P protein component
MPTLVSVVSASSARPKVWRITDRSTFLRLRTDGRRARRGPLSVVHVPLAPVPLAHEPPEPPRVAFTVGKAAGGAVVRNRIRRRMRAACLELVRDGALPPGAYLVGASTDAATLPWDELVTTLRSLVGEVAP